MRNERRRRLIVGAAKIGLPLFALGVFAALFVFNGARYDARISFDGIDPSSLSEGLKILNPRFTGATRKGEPFTVSAASALPNGPKPTRIELEDAKGEIALADGRNVTATAKGGVLLPKANEVRLSGGVRIETSDGYRLTAPEAALFADEDKVTAEGGVEAEGPLGRITAERLRATRGEAGEGAYIWFEERVKVRIDRPDAERG